MFFRYAAYIRGEKSTGMLADGRLLLRRRCRRRRWLVETVFARLTMNADACFYCVFWLVLLLYV